MSAIKNGSPNDLPFVPVACGSDEFDNAIRKFGVVSACEWFGHAPDSEFTADTIKLLEERSRSAEVCHG